MRWLMGLQWKTSRQRQQQSRGPSSLSRQRLPHLAEALRQVGRIESQMHSCALQGAAALLMQTVMKTSSL